MSEEQLFLAALDQPDPSARAVYLDETCGVDTGLRRQVEALLATHFRSGEFLDVPAVEQIQAGSTGDNTITLQGDSMASDRNADDGLHFLTPSTRPDSLGRIGHYEVLQVLGKGGFGIVFRAFDDVLQRVVAVKVMAPEIATLSPARKRFVREARSSAAVRHENVVQVYEVCEQPLPYLVMEFIPGETLQQKLDRNGPLDVTEVLQIGRQIAEGLAAAHATDLIHRDIKPGNVLIEGGQHRVKITDFGLARAADDASISQSGIIAGTPMYMAPEQALGQKLDQRADLFSLGSVLYQMASGRAPFRANNTVAVLKRVCEDTPRPIREIIPETPQWLCDIIAKLHAKNPDDRYQSAREVADVLADCEAQLKASGKVKSAILRPERQPATAKSGRWKWVAAAVLLLPVIALAVTEFAGMTHLFRGQQATTDPIKPSGGPQANSTASWDGWPADAPKPAIAPFDAVQARAHQEAWAKHLGVPVEHTNSTGMKFVLIPPGEFMMGSTDAEVAAALPAAVMEPFWQAYMKSEGPQHRVVITKPFYLGVNEVTQNEYTTLMKTNPSGFSPAGTERNFVAGRETDKHPVDSVSWDDATDFCNKLNQIERLPLSPKPGDEKATGAKLINARLPTEAEWEFACRAGTTTRYSTGDFERDAESIGWSKENSENRTHAVGELLANPFGLFDVHGNVFEWVQDSWTPDNSRAAAKTVLLNPVSLVPSNKQRVLRGGNWSNTSVFSRASSRHATVSTYRFNQIGFRVAGSIESFHATTPTSLPPIFKNSIGMEFAIVPKGKSWLGGGKDKLGDKEVEIPADFYLGKYEVTQEEWEAVTGQNPSEYRRGNEAVKDIKDVDLKRFPVEVVSWEDCQLFIKRLNEKEKESGWVYRLPREAEWEYACRGGPVDKLDSAFDYYFAKPTNTLLPTQANFNNLLKRTCKVGSYEPNLLGLYDMNGNVHEWCEDTAKAIDGTSHRVARGGHISALSRDCRAATRSTGPPSARFGHIGLRLARVPSGAPSPEAKMPPTDPDRRAAELVLNRRPQFRSGGEWRIERGEFAQALPESARIFFGDANWTDYDFEVEAMSNGKTKDGHGVCLMFRAKDLGNYLDVEVGGWNATVTEAVYFKEGKWGRSPGCFLKIPHEHGRWYKVKIEARGPRIRCSVDGKELLAYSDETLLKGMIGLGTGNSPVRWRNLKVTAPDGQLLWEGFPVLEGGPTKVATDSDRRAAEWVLSIGGKVSIVEGGKRVNSNAVGELPRGPFELIVVGLSASAIFSDADLARFKDCKYLTILALEGMQLTDDGLVHLKNLTKLSGLVLRGQTKITDVGLGHLGEIELDTLVLHKTGITDQGLVQFKKSWASLSVLELGETQLTDDGLKHFAAMKNLRILNLAATKVTDAGLQNLVGLSLERLVLSGTAVTDDGLEHVMKLSRLTAVNLPQTKVTEAGVKKLAAALPKCKIEWDGGVIEPTVPITAAPTVHDTWLKATALLPLDQHAAALPAKLKERLPGFEDAMLRTIPSMAADRQAIMVAAWLRDRNPAFEGEVKHKIEGGVLTSLEVPSPLVQDLTPLRALPGLRTLTGRSTLGYDNQAARDAAVLQALKTLTHINGKPVAQFWKDAEAKQAEFKEWLTLVPTLTAPQQVAAVVAKLKERNPGLEGEATQQIKDGVVAELTFTPVKGQDALTDLSPVRALAGLTRLTLLGCAGLEDLEPLKGMPLTGLNLPNCPQVRNLEPLKGMPLTSLNLYGCRGVENLKSLEGMPLENLVLRHCTQVRDLESLKGMPLTSLSLGATQVRDLEPLKGMPLTYLDLDGTQVRDLELLKGMPLKKLLITGRAVTDLKPLQGMELEDICLTPKNITQGLDILRNMKSLKTIGIGSLSTQVWPAAEFWERYDKGEFKE